MATLPMTRAALIGIVVVAAMGIGVGIYLTRQPGVPAPPALQLSLPLACKIGSVCSIQNYVDRDPGPEARDYTCGRLTYDGHKGTDFRLPDASWLDRGVAVLAAAPGKVAGTRNGVRDHAPGEYKASPVQDRECGNGVVIDHGGGWQTQYCHMRLGSVLVRKGDRVARQQPLGIIGLSGQTAFPHLHLSVRHDGTVVDPFVGQAAEAGCGVAAKPLWEPDVLADLAYRPSGVLAAGFTDQVPTLDQIVSGRHRAGQLGRAARNLVFWVMIFGLQPGDEEVLQIAAPDGRLLLENRGQPAKSHKARWFSYAGKRARRPWQAGTYRGDYQLLRTTEGRKQVVLQATATVRVE